MAFIYLFIFLILHFISIATLSKAQQRKSSLCICLQDERNHCITLFLSCTYIINKLSVDQVTRCNVKQSPLTTKTQSQFFFLLLFYCQKFGLIIQKCREVDYKWKRVLTSDRKRERKTSLSNFYLINQKNRKTP